MRHEDRQYILNRIWQIKSACHESSGMDFEAIRAELDHLRQFIIAMEPEGPVWRSPVLPSNAGNPVTKTQG